MLGCRVHADGTLSRPAERRVTRAAAAWNELGPSWILVAGGRRWGGPAEADAMTSALVAQAVPGPRIIRELCSLSTRENAWYAAPLLRMLGATRIGLVTCDWHMRRACASFGAQGIHPEPLPAGPPAGSWAGGALRRAREAVSRRVEFYPLDIEKPWSLA